MRKLTIAGASVNQTPMDWGNNISNIKVKSPDLKAIIEYHKFRDYPALDKTTYLGPHLRFGTVSIRKIVDHAMQENQLFLGELIWREFFMQILFNFPDVVTGNFKRKFDDIPWRNNEKEFENYYLTKRSPDKNILEPISNINTLFEKLDSIKDDDKRKIALL